MRLSAKSFAAMLMCLALTAFQLDMAAQSRGGSKSSSSRPSASRPSTPSARPAERPSGNRRPDIKPADRTPSKPSATRPSGSKPSAVKPSGSKPSPSKPAVSKPSGPKPALRPAPKPAPKPDLRPAPAPRPPARPPRPLKPRPPRVVIRPAIGTLVAANMIANTALTIARLSYYNNLNQPRERVARNLASQLGLVQSSADAATTYYYQDGVFYTIAPDGSYYVIVPPAGALVEELPMDYDTVYINGNEYFRVDDTLYQYTILDGKPYFEVLGQVK